ncbi:hypothetical protein LEN26_019582 [Aphanomyces euteiches]|nr:hypothetical protein LEN26_019582 [Aphanomyces euteiches]KAH9114725.1 hypothetical protein AeMF1_011187 [Aphanomyces euteiches]KAH9195249.1 hypothetical protein AeNC1_002790 [Aphanomyces euteiches]
MNLVAVAFLAAIGSAAHLTEVQRKALPDASTTILRKFAFGSGNDQDAEQFMWSKIAARQPQLFLSLGNNIYADEIAYEFKSITKGFDRDAPPYLLREKYQKQLNNSDYVDFLSSTPIIGVWDDHDYGRNDAGSEFPFREESQQLFLDFLGEPRDSVRRSQAGIYTSYTFGTDAKSVKVILLDYRFHRDPSLSLHPNDPSFKGSDGDNLGDSQWRWLEEELRSSKATFNIIASTVQVLPNDRWFGTESWSIFPAARERLLDVIQLSHASGVILLSGNVEFAEINQVSCGDDDAYRLTEVTSSGLTHSYLQGSGLFHFISALAYTIVNAILPWYYRADPTVHYGGSKFGQVVFDWESSPPKASVSVIDRRGRTRMETSIPATRFSGTNDSIGCAPLQLPSPGDYMVRILTVMSLFVLIFGSMIVNVIVVVVVPLQVLRGALFQTKPKTD